MEADPSGPLSHIFPWEKARVRVPDALQAPPPLPFRNRTATSPFAHHQANQSNNTLNHSTSANPTCK